jgi:hypothetical protein
VKKQPYSVARGGRSIALVKKSNLHANFEGLPSASRLQTERLQPFGLSAYDAGWHGAARGTSQQVQRRTTSGEHSMSRFVAAFAAVLIAGVGTLAAASAQSYPQRIVRFILPFGPASGVDITARLLGERLAARWGRPVVVENRPGGDGLVAINAFISANDDHTLLFVPASTFTAHPYTPRSPTSWRWLARSRER